MCSVQKMYTKITSPALYYKKGVLYNIIYHVEKQWLLESLERKTKDINTMLEKSLTKSHLYFYIFSNCSTLFLVLP